MRASECSRTINEESDQDGSATNYVCPRVTRGTERSAANAEQKLTQVPPPPRGS